MDVRVVAALSGSALVANQTKIQGHVCDVLWNEYLLVQFVTISSQDHDCNLIYIGNSPLSWLIENNNILGRNNSNTLLANR